MAKNQDCGPTLPGWFASYDPDTSSWRTRQTCLIEGLDEFSGTWPRAGTMRSGRVSALVMWEHPIAVGGRSSVPTYVRSHVPTPVASDRKGSTGEGCRRGSLAEFVMVPTPVREVSRRIARAGARYAQGGISLAAATLPSGTTGYPHPLFVEWLMGFPLGWVTSSEPSETP